MRYLGTSWLVNLTLWLAWGTKHETLGRTYRVLIRYSRVPGTYRKYRPKDDQKKKKNAPVGSPPYYLAPPSRFTIADRDLATEYAMSAALITYSVARSLSCALFRWLRGGGWGVGLLKGPTAPPLAPCILPAPNGLVRPSRGLHTPIGRRRRIRHPKITPRWH
eukprot:SAG11_NODE_3776_length_2244_cov_16.009836_1_plen_163_part_00